LLPASCFSSPSDRCQFSQRPCGDPGAQGSLLRERHVRWLILLHYFAMAAGFIFELEQLQFKTDKP
jgi:hypothetical protein